MASPLFMKEWHRCSVVDFCNVRKESGKNMKPGLGGYSNFSFAMQKKRLKK